jgi:hypothetical protein
MTSLFLCWRSTEEKIVYITLGLTTQFRFIRALTTPNIVPIWYGRVSCRFCQCSDVSAWAEYDFGVGKIPYFYAFCHGREDVTAWLCTIPPKTNSGWNKQTHSKCFRWDGVLISLTRLKRVWSRLFSDIWHQHVQTDAHPLLAIEMKSAHPQWRRWRNLAFF